LINDQPDIDVAIDDDYPNPLNPSEWIAYDGNQGDTDNTFNVLAVCATFPANAGYKIKSGFHKPVDNPPDTQAEVSLSCKPGQYVLGGGVNINYLQQPSVMDTLNETYPSSSQQWTNAENNTGLTDESLYAVTICVG
jgi:hypothetical protein